MISILAVDDNPINRKIYLAILKKTAQCDIAVNGSEALRIYRDAVSSGKKYDAMLLDVVMPEVDGIQVLKTIREEEKSRQVSPEDRLFIVMVTSEKQELGHAYDLGCDDFMVKPVDADKLIEKILAKNNFRKIRPKK